MEGEEGTSIATEQTASLWTEQDTEQFIKAEELIDKIQDASRLYPREQHAKEGIEGYYQQFPSCHAIFRKSMIAWKTGQERSSYIPYLPLINYIEATAKIYEDSQGREQKLEFGVELLGEYLNDFSGVISRYRNELNGYYHIDYAVKALSLYIAYGTNPQLRVTALQGLRENIDYIIKKNEPDYDGYVLDSEYFVYALQLYKEATPEEKSKLGEAILKSLLSKSGLSRIMSFNNPEWSSSALPNTLEPQLLEIVQGEIGKHGVDKTKIMKQWLITENMLDKERSFVYARREISIIDTLKNLRLLEEARPGSAKVLQEMFGINHFGRYPVELLIRQYDERFDISKPYGVILATADDYVEVSVNHKEAFEMLFGQIGHAFSIRITECETKYGPQGIGRRLLEFAKRYNPEGKGHKIGFLVIAGHGSEEGDKVFLGREDSMFNAMRAADFDNARTKKIADYFVEEPDIVFVSCNVGKQIAKAASSTLNARTYADTAKINRLQSVSAKIKGDHVRLNPTFLAFVGGEAVMFIRGVKQET